MVVPDSWVGLSTLSRVSRIPLQSEQVDSFDIGQRTVLSAVLLLVIAYVIAETTEYFVGAVADSLEAERFRLLIVIPMLKVGIYAVTIYSIVVVTIQPSSQQLLAFSGLFGAALGFGFKELVTDILGGLAILFERPYRMGDKITIGDYYGEVVNISLRSTQVETLTDNLVTIPNHVFFTKSIANASAGNAEMLISVEFHISSAEDIETATRLVEEAIITSPYVYVTENHPVLVLVDDDPFYYTITGRAYVNDLRNESEFKTGITQRTLSAFHDHDIEQPQAPPREYE
jgi:small-conductance mechanosensitive channel